MKHTDLKKIVLPEGGDERIIEAAKQLVYEGVCHPVLIGDPEAISLQMGYSDKFTVLPVDSQPLTQLKLAATAKGKEFRVEDEALVQGAALVRDGDADGIVGGAVAGTDDVFLAYVKTIGVRDDVSRVTSCFLMEKGDSRLIFADCGLNPTATTQQLSETAYLSAAFAKTVGIEPIVAFLSFQTAGSAQHDSVQWIAEAAAVARETYALRAVGPLQFDAALLPEVADRKTKNCDVAGHATVYVFPDLNSGNIGYKIAERLGGYQAVGPLFLGFKKPAYDLSRGCSVDDIVRVVQMAVSAEV